MRTNLTTAEIILQQLGGSKFIVMTGAKELAPIKNGLQMKIGRNTSSANRLQITLNGKDLYDMKFIRVTAPTLNNNFTYKEKVLKEYNDVYFDQLQDLFTEYTGMYTHL